MPAATHKRFLFLLRDAPYASHTAQDSLAMLLATAAFNQQVGVVFIDEGVWQLKKGQKPSAQQTNISAQLAALPLYDINPIYVVRESLAERQLTLDDLVLDCEQLDLANLNNLMTDYDCVVGI